MVDIGLDLFDDVMNAKIVFDRLRDRAGELPRSSWFYIRCNHPIGSPRNLHVG
jgi:hypothetical protein